MARSKKVPRIKETLHEDRNRMRQEAIALAEKFKHTKPIILLSANGSKRQLN